MANKKKRWPRNAPGRYYIDEDCTNCGACQTEAPDNIEQSDDGYSFISRQPQNDDEEKKLKAAQESCPVEAIGSDGDDAA